MECILIGKKGGESRAMGERQELASPFQASSAAGASPAKRPPVLLVLMELHVEDQVLPCGWPRDKDKIQLPVEARP